MVVSDIEVVVAGVEVVVSVVEVVVSGVGVVVSGVEVVVSGAEFVQGPPSGPEYPTLQTQSDCAVLKGGESLLLGHNSQPDVSLY